MNDDFRLAEVYISNIIDEIRQLENEHTEPEMIISDNDENSAFIEVSCVIVEEGQSGRTRERRYKVVCPEGYWGKNRQKFIDYIEEKYMK